MHGAAVTLAERYRSSGVRYDAILASDMLDLPLFLSLLRQETAGIPVGLYFHENQILYPWSPRDGDKKKGRDLHYGFINYASALAADKVYFNSDYHRTAFTKALPEFLKRYPDFQNTETATEIARKSETLWLGMDLSAFDPHRRENRGSVEDVPLILWNHRWEYDKNPHGFFKTLYELVDRDVAFDLALVGEGFEEAPPYFEEAKQRLGDRIVTYGKLSQFSEYAELLWFADILLVTSNQDFFGQSVVEAIYCGCHPVLPRRLAYPDHLDPEQHPGNFYRTEEEAADTLATHIISGRWKTPFEPGRAMARYDWDLQIGNYDAAFADLARKTAATGKHNP